MASTRTYSFRIIFFSFLFIGLGFLCGFYAAKFFKPESKKSPNFPLGSGSHIVKTKRMEAIRKAIREGEIEYEFEVEGVSPAINR